MSYTLANQCMGEFLGMMVAIFVGESVVANEVLPGTKGHEMGWGFTSLGFGFAFFIAINSFASCNPQLNPAMLLALWIRGVFNAQQFFALFACEVAGAFTGACLVWIYFLPHFKTVPQPPPLDSLDPIYEHGGDYLTSKALYIASYQPVPHKAVALENLPHALSDIRYYCGSNGKVYERLPTSDSAVTTPEAGDRKPLKCKYKCVKVPELQRRMQRQQLRHVVRSDLCGHCQCEHDTVLAAIDAEEGEAVMLCTDPDTCLDAVRVALPGGELGLAQVDHKHTKAGASSSTQHGGENSDVADSSDLHSKVTRAQPEHACGRWQASKYMQQLKEHREKIEGMYDRAMQADRNAKLSIFCTRPAIYSPAFNFMAEFMGTITLILLAMLTGQTGNSITDPTAQAVYNAFVPFFVGWLIFVLIVGMGGPTAFAVNPARDMGPRLAHFVLPISNKGPSEFITYSWVPFIAPLFGGAVAAGLFTAIVDGLPQE